MRYCKQPGALYSIPSAISVKHLEIMQRKVWRKPEHKKARSASPVHLHAQPWCHPEGERRGCAVVCVKRVCSSDQGVFGCGVGAAGAGTWGQVSSGTFHKVRGT
jgi:hypothetical protein